MRRAAMVLALSVAGLSGCAALAAARGGADPERQLHEGVLALDSMQYTRAFGLLEPLYREYWSQPVGQRAALALIAAELDTRNPERRLWAGADRAARLLNVPQLEAWMVPVAESYYLLAMELGAQEERLAQADSARVAAETRAESAERILPRAPAQSVPARISRVQGERDALQRRLDQLQTQLTTRETELRETRQELERIKRTIKP